MIVNTLLFKSTTALRVFLLLPRYVAKIINSLVWNYGTENPRKRFIAHILPAAASYLLIEWLFGSWYLANDDAAFIYLTRGATFTPEGYPWILFINYSLSRVLSFLFTIENNFNWYYLLLQSTNIFTIATLSYCLQWTHPKRSRSATISFYIFSFLLFFLVTYTATAIFSTLVGFFLLICTINQNTDTKRVLLIGSCILLILGGLWRIEGFIFGTLIFAPVLIKTLVACIKSKSWLFIKHTIIALFPAVTLLLSHQYILASNKEIAKDLAYNSIRIKFNDHVSIDKKLLQNEKAALTENDITLLEHWFYIDSDVYSYENLVDTYNKIKAPPTQAGIRNISNLIASFFYQSTSRFPGNLSLSTLILATLAIIISALINEKNQKLSVLLLFGSLATVLSISFFQKATPDRIYLPLLIFLGCSHCTWTTSKISKRNKYLYVSLLLTSAVLILGHIRATAANNKQREFKTKSTLTSFRKTLNSETIVYVHAAALGLDKLRGLASLTELPEINGIASGWLGCTYANRLQQENLKIDNLMRRMLKPNHLLISNDPSIPEKLLIYFREHFDYRNVTYTAKKLPDFSVIQFSLKDGEKIND